MNILLSLIIAPTFILLPGSHASIISDFELCKSDGFGRLQHLVCDTDEVLANGTKEKLTSLLDEMQTRIQCECEHGCQRSDGNDRYIGLLMVTTTKKIDEAAMPLNESAKEIYDRAQLGNSECDNGLLIVYIKDKQELATYRGSNNFILLKSEEMAKLHNMATKHAMGDDTLALQYLLANYENVVMRSEVQRAETWTPVIGLSLALIIVLLVLGLLLALFLARFCCCCAQSKKKEVYHVTTMPTYKTIEPLFIATPPHSERIMGPHSDVIYSTPYSGTPIPPPHFPAPRPEVYPGSMRSASVSHSVTPASTHKHRIRPAHGPLPRGFTPTGTPATRSRLGSNRVDDSTQTNGTPPSGEVRRNADIPSSSAQPGTSFMPQSPDAASIQRSTGYAESDLSFLDPHRRLEVQTRTDYIY